MAQERSEAAMVANQQVAVPLLWGMELGRRQLATGSSLRRLENGRELELDIMGCDIDAMVEIAKANAQAAGVAGDITLQANTITGRTDEINGVVRQSTIWDKLSDDAGVTKLYAEMGQVFAPLKTWSKFVLTVTKAFSKYGSSADKNENSITGP